jgi:SAM-dependent methyltransferase
MSPTSPMRREPEAQAGAKASEAYWSGFWADSDLPPPANPHSRALGDEVDRAFFRYFSAAFAGMETAGARLIELGAARSQWLPTLQREFGFVVTGLDYSPAGCERARAMLARAQVAGDIVCADLFAPPAVLCGAFDAALSIGVAEHFDDTAACLRAMAAYLKPGGRLITIIPNMRGLPGALQRLADPRIYRIHVPLDADGLAAAHRGAGLAVRQCGPLMAFNLNVIHAARWRRSWAHRPLRRALSAATKLVWLGERVGLALPANGVTSPYIGCTAVKPA